MPRKQAMATPSVARLNMARLNAVSPMPGRRGTPADRLPQPAAFLALYFEGPIRVNPLDNSLELSVRAGD